MAIIVPNSASTFASAACIIGSEGKWVWLGLATPITGSGCVVWYRSSTSTAGRELLPMNASPGQVVGMYGPFNSPSGIYAAGVSGGCAIWWMKQ